MPEGSGRERQQGLCRRSNPSLQASTAELRKSVWAGLLFIHYSQHRAHRRPRICPRIFQRTGERRVSAVIVVTPLSSFCIVPSVDACGRILPQSPTQPPTQPPTQGGMPSHTCVGRVVPLRLPGSMSPLRRIRGPLYARRPGKRHLHAGPSMSAAVDHDIAHPSKDATGGRDTTGSRRGPRGLHRAEAVARPE